MAQRGKPIPIPVRLDIRQRRQGQTVRDIAAELRLSKTTVQKYGYVKGRQDNEADKRTDRSPE